MRLDRAAKGLFLTEFLTGFVLAMRYFFKPKATSIIRSRRVRFRRASVASTPCAVIRMVKSAALPASFAKRFALRRRSPSKPVRGAMTERAAPPATTSTW